MNKEDIQKLIGGYATGSLTEEERLKLFEAALDDQELFDALQQEQTLKDLFDDPFSRDMVRRAVAESLPEPQTSRRRSWFRQPWIWASATSLAMAAVLVIALVRWDRTPPQTNRAATVRERPQQVENSPTEPQPRPTTEAAGAPAGRPPAGKPTADHAKGLARLERRATVAGPTPGTTPPPPTTTPEPLRQPDQIQSKARGPEVAPAPPSKTAEEKPRARAAPETVETKSARTAQSKSKALGNATGLAKKAEPRQAAIYSFAKRSDDGPFVEVPADTVFRTGEIVRVMIAPRASGPLSIWESDATNPEWKRLFPAADSKKVSLRVKQDYAIPVDIVVQKEQRLRVTAGAAVTYVSIPTESLPAK